MNDGVTTSIKAPRGVRESGIDKVAAAAAPDDPPHNLWAEHVEHRAALEIALTGGVFGDVREPDLVWLIGVKAPLEQVVTSRDVLHVAISARRARDSLEIEASLEL